MTEQPATGQARPDAFQVHLEVFEGPFDLLLGLIAKHKLDITEVSLHRVTDEFIAHIRARGPEWDLDQASHFLLVAATLLDLKAARLLPTGEVEDEEDLALLEARDLLFARLLQYRAYKEVAKVFSGRMAEEALRYPRVVPMEARFAGLLPELVLGIGPERLAKIAARAFTPKLPPTVSTSHIYQPVANVREQAAILVARLRRVRRATFRALTADCAGTYEVIARFLAVLELFREAAVSFEQLEPLGDLHVIWTGADDGDIAVADDYDEGAPPAERPQGDDSGPGERSGREEASDDS
ncbi:segregation/condensation protein A [Sphaerisporangium siamense]|uniref:Segregation and condensation protein A n=1 Tax=Sphaerisporangium siamense TaxID=795645 RepID=A0A7W7DEQ4_9ACTN|nr:segregation/condensation protein A [Sphaerisporangium siamense]MBB4704660.1 segregation and condensation protein A [Sphaerisporangium siamense]GII86275.1 segregation/condensation protein A [Sphaerisporangium siamense]